jgi:hypothetical protein
MMPGTEMDLNMSQISQSKIDDRGLRFHPSQEMIRNNSHGRYYAGPEDYGYKLSGD